MTDGTGTINYHYNSLSQLDYETRQFAGPLSGVNYTLSYQYNLGGELKKITDHTNTTINYNYYRTGALQSVTGENNLVGQVSSYAANIEYRAWGAVRQVSLGNGTAQQTQFSARLLPSSFSINNVALGSNSSASLTWTYDYYNDGRQRRALGSYDDRFDRLLEYDQVGRLKEAFSGREARGLAASSPYPDSPYRQTFQHNAFDERTEKSGRFWRTSQSGTTPCTPRQVNDACDAEGNVVNYVDLHRYDAAGKQVHFENWHYSVGDGTVNPVDSAAVIDQTYDANGQTAKRVETRRTETLVNGGPETSISETVTTTYYLYSSVLGGARVVELDANGNKTTGYVYANGTRLAKQVVGEANAVLWHHANAGTNSWIETGIERVPEQQERDPDGAAVGLQDPWENVIEPVAPSYLKLKEEEPLYIEGGDPFDYSAGLTIDGLPVSAAEFARRVGDGTRAVGVQYQTGNGIWHWAGAGTRIFTTNGGYSVLLTETSSNTTGIIRGTDRETGEEIDTIVGNRNVWSKWTFVQVGIGFRVPLLTRRIVQPQNPTPSPTPRELDCHGFADYVQMIADKSDSKRSFMDELARTFTGAQNSSWREMLNNSAGPSRVNTTDNGFKAELREPQDTHNQARHYVGGFIAAAHLGEFFGRRFMNDRETPGLPDYASDTALNRISTRHASDFIGSAHGIDYLRRYLARRIRIEVCGDKP